ncbi:J domain-containing protein [Paenibacillus polygoni]|uniref:J domain-containing protein n=1 Tax=Paenibacillus polygoni TaxID=3050112 RepID=A0ABY8XCA0_9BACL|nr:J domain-containing protein [Paenibacillus polygoni]WIV21191.1 J domain-containing protein [Paenibacillus polygoni]
MTDVTIRMDEIKRKLRKLKKLELKIRMNSSIQPEKKLIWDNYFGHHGANNCRAKYSLLMLASMNREEYLSVINEYLSIVYYELYKESGIIYEEGMYDPDILSKLGIPTNADENSIKKRFRELAKKYHPDTGGDASMFIELMDNYKKLMGGKS